MILPPRPKHLRSPTDSKSSSNRSKKSKTEKASNSSSSKHTSSSSSKSGSGSHSSKHHNDSKKPHSSRQDRHDKSQFSAPPPPTISGPLFEKSEGSLLQLTTDDGGTVNTSTGVSMDWVVFRGPEHGDIDTKDLKKIQIDIRRNIPENKTDDGPVIRDLGDPLRLVLPRYPTEGNQPMFSRDYIQANAISEEKTETAQKVCINVAPLEEYERKLVSKITGGQNDSSSSKFRKKERSRSRSPRSKRETSLPLSDDWKVVDDDFDDSDRLDVRARLGGREKSPKERRDVRERLGVSVKDRLGEQLRDDDDWNHDFGGYRGNRGHYRGGRRGRGYRGRGRKSDYGLRRSDDWKYEKYQEYEEPSSTTD